ncbi:MAG TPA: hypothetical protein VHB25_20530 [Gemmatimonadaceae bacterium]|nr:hypothetical protein [Gemmatimonadaceae bacterium]
MGASVAAAAIVARERHIVDAYRAAGATTPDTAAAPDALGVAQRLAFRILVRDAVLRETKPGYYYLDEPSWQAKRGTRQRVALIMLMIMALLLAGMAVAGVLRIGS